MDETLSDREREDLKAAAIKALREDEADLDRSEELHQYQQKGQVHMVGPERFEWVNENLRKLRRAGVEISDWDLRPPHTTPWKPVKTAQVEQWANGSELRAKIKRILREVDPQG